MRIVICTPAGDAPAHIECRALGLALDAPTLPEAARTLQGAVVAEIAALAPAAEHGMLTAPGCRRLAMLRELEAVVSRHVSPGA